MNSRTTKRFRQMLAELPSNIRQQAKEAYKLFVENLHHPSLRFKKAHNTEPIDAVRININYRAVGVIENGVIVWFWSGIEELVTWTNLSHQTLTYLLNTEHPPQLDKVLDILSSLKDSRYSK